MSAFRSVTKLLAPLLVLDDVSLRVVALIGETITADARLCDFGEGKTVRANLDAIIEMGCAYEDLQDLAEIAVNDFEEHRDGNRLNSQISDIRDRLIALY